MSCLAESGGVSQFAKKLPAVISGQLTVPLVGRMLGWSMSSCTSVIITSLLGLWALGFLQMGKR